MWALTAGHGANVVNKAVVLRWLGCQRSEVVEVGITNVEAPEAGARWQPTKADGRAARKELVPLPEARSRPVCVLEGCRHGLPSLPVPTAVSYAAVLAPHVASPQQDDQCLVEQIGAGAAAILRVEREEGMDAEDVLEDLKEQIAYRLRTDAQSKVRVMGRVVAHEHERRRVEGDSNMTARRAYSSSACNHARRQCGWREQGESRLDGRREIAGCCERDYK